jgi:hypothetical protein
VRSDIRKFIEDTVASKGGVKNLRVMNNDTAIANKLADAIMDKENADAIRQMLSPFAPAAVGGSLGFV